MYVDKQSPIPVYYQLKNIILAKIRDGEYPAGSLIPSERDLGENLNISRMTVRQALNQLVSEGVLYREKGKGTFVAKAKLEQRNIMSFSEVVRRKQMVPSTRILHFGRVDADDKVSGTLELNKSEKVFILKRLRLANDLPVGIEEDFIPERYCPDLDRFDLTGSLYKTIKAQYNLNVSYMDNIIEASRPTRDEKELLEISFQVPVLKLNSINYTHTGVKLFYERSVYRSDEYQYNVRVFMNKNME